MVKRPAEWVKGNVFDGRLLNSCLSFKIVDIMKNQLLSYKPGIYQVTNKFNFHLNFHFKMGMVETYNPVITRVRQKELEVRDELRLQSSKLAWAIEGNCFSQNRANFYLKEAW